MEDHDQDRYRDLRDVFERCINDDDFPTSQVVQLNISLLASGEATWRVWTRDAEEPVGGYLTPDDSV